LLKFIVIGLGALIVAVLVLMIVVGIQRAGRLVATNAGAPAPVGEAPGSFGDKALKLAKGARVIEVRIAGDRMIVRTRQLGGQEELVVLSLVSGERLGSFAVNPE